MSRERERDRERASESESGPIRVLCCCGLSTALFEHQRVTDGPPRLSAPLLVPFNAQPGSRPASVCAREREACLPAPAPRPSSPPQLGRHSLGRMGSRPVPLPNDRRRGVPPGQGGRAPWLRCLASVQRPSPRCFGPRRPAAALLGAGIGRPSRKGLVRVGLLVRCTRAGMTPAPHFPPSRARMAPSQPPMALCRYPSQPPMAPGRLSE